VLGFFTPCYGVGTQRRRPRRVGAVSATWHGAATRRHDNGGVRMTHAHLAVNNVLILGAVGLNEATRSLTWSSKGPIGALSSTSLAVRVTATIGPVSASTPRCDLRRSRPVLMPGCSASPSPSLAFHSPGERNLDQLRPNRTASAPRCPPAGARARCQVVAVPPPVGRRLRMAWSGTAISRPSRAMMEPISASRSGAGATLPAASVPCHRQGRGARLPARCRPWLAAPGRDRRIHEPDGQAAALAQGRVTGGSIRGPMSLPGHGTWDGGGQLM